jgi:hypothetical protein
MHLTPSLAQLSFHERFRHQVCRQSKLIDCFTMMALNQEVSLFIPFVPVG